MVESLLEKNYFYSNTFISFLNDEKSALKLAQKNSQLKDKIVYMMVLDFSSSEGKRMSYGLDIAESGLN